MNKKQSEVRIIQELIGNILKHAKAQEITGELNASTHIIKNGVDPNKEEWHIIKNINEFFQLARTLSKRERDKLFEDFKGTIEVAILQYEKTECVSGDKEREIFTMKAFGWSNNKINTL